MTGQLVLVERVERVAVLTLNRPEARNAINTAITVAMAEAIDAAEADDEVWVLVITGSGDRSFCSGADLKEVAAGPPPVDPGAGQQRDLGGFAGITGRRFVKPVIAAVNGTALGGGTEICLACDLVVADDHATFGLPEVRRGLFAGAMGLERLPRRIPPAIAMELILTGQAIDAARALQLGLINRVVAKGTCVGAAVELGGLICEGAPLAVRYSKAVARSSISIGEETAASELRQLRRAIFASDDFREGAEGVRREASTDVDGALMTLPLSGVRVVDTTDGHGEMCGRFLADLGADVVLVEPIGGAASRRTAPAIDGTSFGFAVRAANKRSVALDLAADIGQARFAELLGAADVWIDGHRPGELAAAGFDPAAVHDRFPRLVVAAITDFGLTGPYRDWVASDWELFALGGQLSRSGVPGRPPFMPPGELADETSAIQGAWCVLLALWNREQTGAGDLLDISRFEATAQVVDPAFGSIGTAAAQSGAGVPDGRVPAVFYPIFRCADGYVRIVVLAPRQWQGMRAWLGEPEEFTDPRYDRFGGGWVPPTGCTP